jgi:hypothetical protein
MRSRTLLVLTTVGVALAASVAEAGDIRVKSGRHGLRRALEKAKPGDRILLRGVVRGDVSITVPGITIEGGRHGKFVGRVSVEADGVTISNAKFKNAELAVTGDDVSIVENLFLATPVVVTGDDAFVARNEIEPGRWVEGAVTVHGDSARIQGNAVSQFYGGVRVAGADAIVSGNTFDDGYEAVVLVGDDAAVLWNVVGGVTAAVVVAGDRATLEGNDLQGENSVLGDDAKVFGNEMQGGSGVATLVVSGESAVVTGNTLTGSWGGTLVQGDGATIADNVVTVPSQGFGAGIASVGDGALISGNDVTVERPWAGCGIGGLGCNVESLRGELDSSGNDGIAAFGNGALVVDNEVDGSFAGGAAVRVQGDANAVDSNDVHDATRAYAIAMIGDGNIATSNDVSDIQGEGVVVQGEDGLVADTNVNGVSSCGFLLVGNTVLTGCTATGCEMGIVNLAQQSSIVGSTVSGNAPYDLVDLGGTVIADDSVVGWIVTDPATFQEFESLQQLGFVPAPTPHVERGTPNIADWN